MHWDNVSNNSLNSLEVTHIRSIVVKAGDTMTVLAVTDKGVIKVRTVQRIGVLPIIPRGRQMKNMFKIITTR